jgi:hypothetical protein
MVDRELTDQKLDAQLREADLRLNMLELRAEARDAKDDLDEIIAFRVARDRVGQRLADIKQAGPQSLDRVRNEVSGALYDLQVRIEHASDRYDAWDAVRQRHFSRRVAEAEAQLAVWNARSTSHWADGASPFEAELAWLKQHIEIAKTKFNEWETRENQATQNALVIASRQLDAAFKSMARKFNA